jgi:PPOX class probable F420-dependent enzyme
MPQPTAPASHQDLLYRPLFAHLATIRPDGAPQSGLMWFAWDGERARFSHTRTRQKIRNLAHEPKVSFHLVDPDNPYRTLEVRGRVESIEADPDATFYRSLQERYDLVVPVFDADIRVVITVAPTSFVAVDGGLTDKEITALTERLATSDHHLDDLGNGSPRREVS